LAFRTMLENKLRLRIEKVHQVWEPVVEEQGLRRELAQVPETVRESAQESGLEMVLAWVLVLGLLAPDNQPVLTPPSIQIR